VALTQRVSVWKYDSKAPAVPQKLAAGLLKPLTVLQFASTAHIARQNRQLCLELAQLDALVDGGIVRGRISQLIDPINAGPTSLAAALAASVTYRDQVVARTTRHIGQCWYPEHSTDHRRHNLSISPALEDPGEDLHTLAHELLHCAAEPDNGHQGQLVKIAKTIGFKAPWPSPGLALIARINGLLVNLEPYPHAAMDKRGRKKQDTRLLKVVCGAGGYTGHVTR
jgi:hypothetical protein